MKRLFILGLVLLNVTDTFPQLNFSISADKPVYRYGDNVYVTVKAVNNGGEDDTIYFSSCLQADYEIDSLSWAGRGAWCQAFTSRIVPSHGSTMWGSDYFDPYPFPGSALPPLAPGRHAVIGKVGGYWTSDTMWIEVSTVAGTTDPAGIPEDYVLENNYPNPFNPTTTIRFAIPKSSFVTLKVFNILGEEISTVLGERLPAGAHSVQWDGSPFPNGVYFYRLQAGPFLEIKTLVLLK